MAITIKNPEAEKLARWLARRRKVSITEAVTDALRKEAERERRRVRPGDLKARLCRIDAIVARYRSRPGSDDDRPPDAIVGYNDQGLFG